MNLLAIDTSTERASVALAAGDEIFCEEHGALRQHAQLLLPMIERLLTTSGVTLNQLDGIVLGRGPGSFTGLRIACSVVQGLALAADKPVYPVSSLAVIAYQARQKATTSLTKNILAVIDARMQQVYWGAFTEASFDADEQVSAMADISSFNASFILAGVGFEPYLSEFPEAMSSQMVERQVIFPNAGAMIQLVKSGAIPAVTAHEAQPVYVRNQVTQGEVRG